MGLLTFGSRHKQYYRFHKQGYSCQNIIYQPSGQFKSQQFDMAHRQVFSEQILTPPLPSFKTSKPSQVQVYCRVKPLKAAEEAFEMQIDPDNSQISIPQPRQQTTKTFTFNRIFLQEEQRQFVEKCCAPILESAIQHNRGYLVFSYGVTNSGKTYTILGSKEEPGILPNLISKLSRQCEVQVSAIELYNDEFYSLANKQKLVAREQNGFLDFSQCLTPQKINPENLDQKIKLFINNRTQNQTKMNAKSSRSHAIFKIQAGDVVIGVVDLAGSERTNRDFITIDETSNINKSLLCLGRCIKALNEQPEGQNYNIPYRESKLTKMLIQYFAAKTQVLMIANINQQKVCYHENMKVLDYAVLAKDIRHCSTDANLSKSIYKSKSKPKKVDVFESLYKSASKSNKNIAHKSLKSSRTKIAEAIKNRNLSRKELLEQNDKFSKILKAKQLQMYLDRYNTAMGVSQQLEAQIEEIQQREEEKVMENLKTFDYLSPNAHYRIPHRKSVAIGHEQSDLVQCSQELKQKMKEELKALLEQQRRANMNDGHTQITTSFKKKNSEAIELTNEIHVSLNSDKIVEQTPVKKIESEKKSTQKNTDNLWSTGKKLISNTKIYLKNLCLSKQKPKKQMNLQICTQVFSYDPIDESRVQNSQVTFSTEPPIKHYVEVEVQTDEQEPIFDSKHSFIEDDTQQTSNCSDMSLIHVLRVSEVSIRQSEVIVEQKKEESDDETQSNAGTVKAEELYENLQEIQEKARNNKKRTKKAISRQAKNEQARRVEETRKMAARICRQQSRTPLKRRLRNRKQY